MMDWNDAFDNASYVPDANRYFDIWLERAKQFRGTHVNSELALPYGPLEREKLDLFFPDCQPKGLVVVIHGGYWLRLDRGYFSDLAAGPLEQGWAVAVPSYTLAPDARIHEITKEIALAITYASSRIDGPIRVVGHSAGGHLAARMLYKEGPLGKQIQKRIIKTVSISGLHDLRNLCKTELNDTLQLTEHEAVLESPCLNEPFKGSNITCWVGGAERPEFIKQSHELHGAWQAYGIEIDVNIDGVENHYTVIDGLKRSESKLTQVLLG